MADRAKESVAATAQEALEHGKQVAQETAATAQDAAQSAVADIKETAQQAVPVAVDRRLAELSVRKIRALPDANGDAPMERSRYETPHAALALEEPS